MKNNKLLSIGILLLFTLNVFAQKAVKGKVIETASGEGLPGVSIIVKGSMTGASTDFDGNFEMNNIKEGAVLVFSYIGFQTKEVTITTNTNLTVSLDASSEALDEVVVVGYGTVKKKDATGAVTTVTSKDLNKSVMTSPEQLLSGKSPGVQITSGGGAPGDKQTIRIRGGASLSASNDPLIVIDGVPLDNEDVSGLSSPLSSINPNDIESFTILKDASATAIYGSRASNGVIIITTKKGKSGDLKVNYNGNVAIGSITDQIDALSADDFRALVNEKGNAAQIALLGNANTNWQDQIFQTSISTSHDVSVSGGKDGLNYRASVGYTNEEGALKTSALDRTTMSLALSKSFFDDHLKVNLNSKTASVKTRFADKGAIGNAVRFDPTQTVYGGVAKYGNYFQWLNNEGNQNTLATSNPLALLLEKNDSSQAYRFISNLQFDYKLHFLPELRANLNIALDKSVSNGNNTSSDVFFDSYTTSTGLGAISDYNQEKTNKLLDFYLNYATALEGLDLDATVGYSYQDFYEYKSDVNTRNASPLETKIDILPTNLQSYFGRVKLGYQSKYLLTLTYRLDGTSRFIAKNRWGGFPAAAFAWNVIDEDFMENSKTFSNLKLRLGWGVTGQQNLGKKYTLPYVKLYTESLNNSQYQIGDNFIVTQRPDFYNETLKWEETSTLNLGLDFGLFAGKVNGSVDVYKRDTKDLLIDNLPFPGLYSLSNVGPSNVGKMENKGIEFNINTTALETDNLKLDFGFNITYNDTKITQLNTNEDPNYQGIPQGGIEGGTGNKVQIHSVGYTPHSFYVFQQVYEADGKTPINGVFVDRSKDGQISEADLYRYEKPTSDVFLGFNTALSYDKWDFNMVWRGSFGNYVYNNIDSNAGYYNNSLRYDETIANAVGNVLESKFTSEQFLSDYYIQNASFLKLDNVTIGYRFDNVFNKKANLKVYGTVQNVLTITDYDGLDPEIQGGIDNNIYPRSRTFLFGVNLDF
ncbi:SusC/RagA family TonB-linked outer membrane protein [Bacteroidota bacterium]